MMISTARLVTWFTNALGIGGGATLVVSLIWDASWIEQWQYPIVIAVAALGLRCLNLRLGKYSYISPTAVVALSGALLVGPVPTALGLSTGTALADRVVHRKSMWAVLVNVGREVVSLYAAFGFFAATMFVANAPSPVSPEGVPALVVFTLSYFLYWRWLFYFSLLIRDKLVSRDRQFMLRYEVIVSSVLAVGAWVVVFSMLVLPVNGWVFMGALLAAAGLLAKRMLEEAIRAEELNKLHAMDAIVSGAISLHDTLMRIEQLAHRILDWDDLRIFRRAHDGNRIGMVYRGAIGRPGRDEPSVEFEALRESVLSSGNPIIIRHAVSDVRTATLPASIASAVVYPIKLGDDIIGTFELEHHKPGAYRREQLPLLDACVNRIATAMHIADLRRPLLDTVERIGKEVDNLRSLAQSLGASATDMQSASAAMGENLSKQDNALGRSLDEAARLNAEGRLVAEGGANAATSTAQATHMADQSRATLSSAIEKLADLRTIVDSSTGQVNDITMLARTIVTRLGTIKESADLTHLLALNTGIELARSTTGERGFGVVADEIRQLAEGISTAAAEMVGLVSDVRERLAGVVDQLRRGHLSVSGAATMGTNGLEALESIVDSTRGATAAVRRIALSAEEQRGALQDLRERLAAVVGLSRQNRRDADRLATHAHSATDRLAEVTHAIHELDSVAAMLADLTERFTFVDTNRRE